MVSNPISSPALCNSWTVIGKSNIYPELCCCDYIMFTIPLEGKAFNDVFWGPISYATDFNLNDVVTPPITKAPLFTSLAFNTLIS